MNYFKSLKADIASLTAALTVNNVLPAGLPLDSVTVEPPRDPKHGDVATNVAMVLAKPAGRAPRDIAQALIPGLLALPHVAAAEVAGPGFVNLKLRDSFWHNQLVQILQAGTAFGRSDQGRGVKANVEYVSANPTGPMHVGHARGAVVGDALASVLEFAGYAVTREYYINDAGGQVDALARSLHWRYREALGEAMPAQMPEGLYPGDYLKAAGAALAQRDGTTWVSQPESAWLAPIRDFAIDAMMAMIRSDLELLGIRQEVFSSERGLVQRGGVDEALALLETKGLIYKGVLEPPKGMKPDDWEPREQTLFRSTGFGDDVDRPLRKSDGSWTYFAGDAAYHLDKIRRGFGVLIDVWGADHGGHVKRMQAIVKAFSDGKVTLDCKLCQLVNLLDQGQPVKMSKRAGSFVTLRDVVEAVGRDVVRFIMLTRRNDVALDFDLAKVQEQSKDNPVFYVQYAHARCRSILRKAAEEFPGLDAEPARLADPAVVARLTAPGETDLIKLAAGWPRVVEGAAEAHEPHRLAFYLHELAAAFHAHWNRGNDDPGLRFLVPGDRAATEARLALVQGVRLVIAAGLGIMGVQPAEELH